MSVKGAAIGHSGGRSGLGRKLSDSEPGKSIWSWRPKSLKRSNLTKHKSRLTCQDTKGENVLSQSSEEKHHMASVCEDEASPESLVMVTMSSSTGQTHLEDLNPKPKQQGLKAWRKCFSLMCCRRKTADDKSDRDEDESHDFMFFNKLTRDSVDITVQPNVMTCILTREEVERVVPKLPAVVRREKYKVTTRKIFQRFSRKSPGGDSKVILSGPNTSCLDPCVIISRGEKTGPFWRRRVQKPSPFFQERIEQNRDYIEEETIVLANRHTDDPAGGNNSVSPPQNGQRDTRRRYPETLTVSVDVSASTSELKEVRSTEIDADASETQQEEQMKEPDGCGTVRQTEALEMLVAPYPPENYGASGTAGDWSSPEENVNVEMNLGLFDGHDSSAADLGLTATGNKIPLLTPDSDQHLDNLAFRSLDKPNTHLIRGGIIDKDQSLECDKSHADNEQSSPCDLSSSLETVSDRTCHYCVLLADDKTALYHPDLQPTETVLTETACLVVQFVMKAALDQFNEELLESDVTQLTLNQLRNNWPDKF